MRRGISKETLRLFNITWYQHPQIGPAIRIPINDTHAKYRRDPLDDRKPKYVYDSGAKVTLYGFDKLEFSGTQVVVTEGELDALVLWSQNIPAVSSTGGAMSFQTDWADPFPPHTTFYICYDNDNAGAEGAVRTQQILGPERTKIVLIPEQPDVKDISDFVARGGDFRSLMESAKCYTSTAEVEEDKKQRQAQWLSTRFHQAYLDKHRETYYRAAQLPTSFPDDEVLRAKQYPIGNLLEFTRHKAVCPFHNERTPSLHYYGKTNSCYCFGACGRAYDAIDLYQHLHSCSFKDAVTELNKLV